MNYITGQKYSVTEGIINLALGLVGGSTIKAGVKFVKAARDYFKYAKHIKRLRKGSRIKILFKSSKNEMFESAVPTVGLQLLKEWMYMTFGGILYEK